MKRTPLKRGTSRLSRSTTLARSAGIKRASTKPGKGTLGKAGTSAESREIAFARSGGMCVRPGCRASAVEAHHVLPKQANKWPALVDHPANLVALCRAHHASHESAADRLLRAALPPETLELAESVGAMWYIELTYPV